MTSTVDHLLNKSQGTELNIACIKCTGETAHKVLVSVDVRGSEGHGGHSFDWHTDYQIVQCQGCKSLSYRTCNSNSEDYFYDENGESHYNESESIYPPRLKGIKGLGDEVIYLPQKVREIYDETMKALSLQAPVLAAIGLRALLETVCIEKEAIGANLLRKIDCLVEMRILTPTSASILHKIRALGNAAAHEVKPHSERQLALAMDIVEHLLKDVYILPKQAESEFESEA